MASPTRPTHPRFGLANLTYLWRRGKEELGGLLGREINRGEVQRPGFAAQQAHSIFLDLGENAYRQHNEAMKERLRKGNLKSILQSDFGRAYSTQLLRETMVKHLTDHGINEFEGIAFNAPQSDFAHVMNAYHAAENRGISVNGERVRLDEKYHFKLGRHDARSEARAGNYLGDRKDAVDFLHNVMVRTDKISLGTALSRYREVLKEYALDKNAVDVNAELDLTRRGHANYIVSAIHSHLPSSRYPFHVLDEVVSRSIRNNPQLARVLEQQARNIPAITQLTELTWFRGVNDPARRRNLINLFHNMVNIPLADNTIQSLVNGPFDVMSIRDSATGRNAELPNPELRRHLRIYANSFTGNSNERYARAARFLQLVHTQYPELVKVLRDSRRLSPQGPKEDVVRKIAKEASEQTVRELQKAQEKAA